MVLLIPTVLVMLGDNPMSSEFACHVRLTGKFFCCCCWVKGCDAEDEGPNLAPNNDSASVNSDAGSERSVAGTHRRKLETLSQLQERAKQSLEVCLL